MFFHFCIPDNITYFDQLPVRNPRAHGLGNGIKKQIKMWRKKLQKNLLVYAIYCLLTI